MKTATRTRPKITAAEPMYSIREAAPLIHLHPQTLKMHCMAGRIRCTKPGNRYLIPASAIDAFLTRHAVAMPVALPA